MTSLTDQAELSSTGVNMVSPEGSCHILVGTCGYSYAEWRDSGFYSAATRSADMLLAYARCFPIVELNYTWYQMARAEAISRMVAKAPSNFQFAAKLTRTLTHERRADWRRQLRLYRDGIAPMEKRLAAILVQLPPDFERTRDNRSYLAELLDGLHGLPVAVEFRHRSWAQDTVFAELERRKVTLVTVDQPDLPFVFPTLDVVTNPDFFYVRFHGRNQAGYQSSNMQKKFDYDYAPSELQEFHTAYTGKMSLHTKKGLVFFNNHVRAQAPRNGKIFMEIIENLSS